MKTIYLTSGPRGAGKSTYVKQLIKSFPDIVLVDRDEILMKTCGKTFFQPGEDNSPEALWMEKINFLLSSSDNIKMIVDAWNADSFMRSKLIKLFRHWEVGKVICLYFNTPFVECSKWLNDNPINPYPIPKEQYWREHGLYHQNAILIEADGFDKILYINPLELNAKNLEL